MVETTTSGSYIGDRYEAAHQRVAKSGNTKIDDRHAIIHEVTKRAVIEHDKDRLNPATFCPFRRITEPVLHHPENDGSTKATVITAPGSPMANPLILVAISERQMDIELVWTSPVRHTNPPYVWPLPTSTLEAPDCPQVSLTQQKFRHRISVIGCRSHGSFHKPVISTA